MSFLPLQRLDLRVQGLHLMDCFANYAIRLPVFALTAPIAMVSVTDLQLLILGRL
jgi:hypothetical protein